MTKPSRNSRFSKAISCSSAGKTPPPGCLNLGAAASLACQVGYGAKTEGSGISKLSSVGWGPASITWGMGGHDHRSPGCFDNHTLVPVPEGVVPYPRDAAELVTSQPCTGCPLPPVCTCAHYGIQIAVGQFEMLMVLIGQLSVAWCAVQQPGPTSVAGPTWQAAVPVSGRSRSLPGSPVSLSEGSNVSVVEKEVKGR